MRRHAAGSGCAWGAVCRGFSAGLALLLVFAALPAAAAETLRVGSKRFTESYVLGEIVARTAQQAGGVAVEHKPGLGNTAILFAALKSGAIDVYPDYSGTVALELLGLSGVPSLEELNRQLAPHGLAAGVFFGFSNSYAFAMREALAAEHNIRRISDLRRFPQARLALSPEFLNRRDGWPAMRDTYDIDGLPLRGLDHGLAYEALARAQVDVIDVYTTDSQILRQKLRLLEDDQRFFPDYEALLVYRADLPLRHPGAWRAVEKLQGAINAAAMRRMNAAVELDRRSFGDVAGEWLQGITATAKPAPPRSLAAVLLGDDLLRLTLQHLLLVTVSLLLSVVAGIPLGIWAQRMPWAGHWIIGGAGILQTVPSLALLAFMIAALDRIGALPAILALFLYALLPVIRNTETALGGISRGVIEAGMALGLNRRQRLLLVELPLAMPGVLAGIRTAAVINVGTATIAAFIGAGGYGERIVAGLAVNDHVLLLAGAIPAAVLAVLIESGFRLLERRLLRRA